MVTEREGGPAAGPAKATAWTALVTTAFMSLVVTGAVGISQGIFAVYWVRDLGASRGSIMAAGVSASIIGGFMAVPMGRLLAGRLHAHVLLAFGAVCGAVSCLLFALATEVWQIVLTLAVTVALALAATGPLVGQSLAVRLFPKPGFAISIVGLGMKGASAIMPVVVALMIERWSFKIALGVMAIIVLATGPLAFLLVRPVARIRAPAASVEKPRAPAASVSAMSIIGDSGFWGLILLTFPMVGLSSSFLRNMALYVVELGGKPKDAAFMYTLSTVCSAAILPLVGKATDRFDLRLLLIASIVLIAGAVGLLSFTPSIPGLMGASMGFSFSTAIFIPSFAMVLRARFGVALFPRANGLAQPFFYIASLLALLTGALRDRLDSYATTFQIVGMTTPLAVVGYIVVARALGRPAFQADDGLKRVETGEVRTA